MLEAAGIAIPPSMQGRSLLPILKDASAPWRDAFLYEYFWERSFPQTPTVLGVRTDKYKFMKFHGVWDRYELYDIQADPAERHNLIGDITVKNEGGPVDVLIRSKASPAVKPVFDEMQKRLGALLAETGALDEPSWRGADIID